MSPSFQRPSSIRALTAVLSALALPGVAVAQPAPAPAAPAAPPAPPNAAPAAPTAPPAATPSAPSEDDDATMDADPNAPAAAPQSPTAPTPTPPAPPPAATTPPSAPSPAAAKAAEPAKSAPEPTPADEPAEEEPKSETDGALAAAGYPLTPGVTALPLNPDFVFSGYLQGQYEAHQDSEDLTRQGGTLLNQNRFLLRRGRFRIARDWEYAQVLVEIDGNTRSGPQMRFQKAEASLVYGRSKNKDQPPLAQLTIGQFDLPFGFELPYSPKYRWFMERSQVSRALFPGEPDVGARFSGGWSFARYAVAITNGEPLDEKSGFQLQDPNSNKDITVRVGGEAHATRDVAIAGGVSFNKGKGFWPGTDATKSTVNFSDSNANGVLEPATELNGASGQAAKPGASFTRWAVGADLELLLHTQLGWTMLYGEVVLAQNLDRGLFVANPADPNGGGIDMRELGYFVALTQEITKYGVVGIRYDVYDPNADTVDKRRGKLLPYSQKVTTISPLVGFVLPGRARLLFQYDKIKDSFARNASGVPTDFRNDQWTLRLQVNL